MTVMHTSQENLVLEHLIAHKTITGVEAAAIYKIRSLPRRIATLRDRGALIQSKRCVDHTGQRYVKYDLKSIAHYSHA